MITQLISLSLALHPAAAKLQYSVQFLGTVGGSPIVGQAVNDSGEVAGILYSDPHRAYVWNSGVATPLANPSFDFSRARSNNNAGMSVGTWYRESDDVGGAAMWMGDGSFVNLGAGDFFPTDINNRGTVVGYSGVHMKMWSKRAGLIDLGPGRAAAINDGGEIVGTDYFPHAVVIRGNTRTVISVPGWQDARGIDINNKGDILVNVDDNEGTGFRTVVADHGGGFRTLPVLDGYPQSGANAINNNGDVVGQVSDGDVGVLPVLWPAKGGIVVLSDVAAFPAGTYYPWPRSINNKGQIVVLGYDVDANVTSTFLLTPSH